MREAIGIRYERLRRATEGLCETLATEDYVVQSTPEASPTRWHLAHTSWFFETFVLRPHLPGYRVHHPRFEYLFNSYYNAVGEQFPRPRRGLLSRPTVAEVYGYRRHVDEHVRRLLGRPGPDRGDDPVAALVELGLQHEQQHQELMLTDIKHVFSVNPLLPVYRPGRELKAAAPGPPAWHAHPGGVVEVGHPGPGFAFDNETPRHRVLLAPFLLASRLTTAGEYLEFIADGGYRRPELWLAEGWDAVRAGGWRAPLYWQPVAGRDGDDVAFDQFTLAGLRPVDAAEPVCHVSYFEADAFARWAGARLPGEAEWEVVAAAAPVEGNFVDHGHFHPVPLAAAGDGGDAPRQLYGDVWEWTRSPYVSYPGFRPPPGALGEYNAKFMCSQLVLRGGSCASPRDHLRPTYRNFFHPGARWQFSGIRLAADA